MAKAASDIDVQVESSVEVEASKHETPPGQRRALLEDEATGHRLDRHN
jgi:hypothetical protein